MQSVEEHPVIEMSRTHPPLVPAVFDPEYRAALADVIARFTPSEMVGAHRWMGSELDRAAGAAFTGHRLGMPPEPGRVVVTNGTQSAFNMLIGVLVGPGNVLTVECPTYPPILVLAARFGLRPRGVAMDEEGMLPEALEELCRTDRPKAIYLLSTLQNPTMSTMSHGRGGRSSPRRDISICRSSKMIFTACCPRPGFRHSQRWRRSEPAICWVSRRASQRA
ncbi:hypothetical protein BSZ19_09260 [Bradyrhizobium japonicum]|uniref:Aminotransferase class I/classII domain-containing protein n=1 Tax=Bradyrhizobium japonicum TaxID=375 RepID=A0A1Y2JTK6_BRAJP|nr:hypothetical protein BSZ19_09260 [Bradyrhizobium japonicum]